MGRHLRLVPPLEAVVDVAVAAEFAHAARINQTINRIRTRHNVSVELTVTDVDGVEVDGDPESAALDRFVMRAEAYAIDPARPRFQLPAPMHRGRLRSVGISSAVSRADFLAPDALIRRGAEFSALYDLSNQLAVWSAHV
ncbi:hypothetical protein BJD60_gp48 [Gordonia phage Schnabeltier]|uniref:Uncharacterized protein n=1 Tax=Gordonia phage Schnabeltier TaxID=1821561 RepID=A0A142KA36_9CAUD|nr:hypothetical protein BJD60_gp48 [Gordonia phage Schnabeltier]AMS02969.1 hypothetical protein SEA_SCHNABELTIER_48 [Gordonia phage Schnabeltier]